MSSNVSSKKHATLRYTSMRASIFLGCLLIAVLLGHFGVIPVTGATGLIFLVLLAALVSAPLSYVLLSKQRDEMSAQLADKVAAMRNRTAERIATQNAEEDAADEAVRAASAKN
ncbi:DUF4229 domain-containing protein [Kitasatospora sp. GP82]|uniref:DUF4229 domain-containing protein n=1 Tax=Kitasatospora sp. GP82 TaxID=3035089 RepID=UPI00247369AB|nr:DUF4229 domain-containing protein [Kitasatospora sp. GP82]MDH6126198.1 mannitol-specific phosphotransferase system IIBC component [Kitasatospora sp. GP82]